MIAYTMSNLNISGCQWLVGKEHIKDTVEFYRILGNFRGTNFRG